MEMQKGTDKKSIIQTVLLVVVGLVISGCAITYAVFRYLNDNAGNRRNRRAVDTRQIYEACKNNDLEAVKELIEQGGNPNFSIRRYHSRLQPIRPVEIASEKGNIEIVKFLGSSSVDLPESRALYFAAQGNNLNLVSFLLESGCRPNDPVRDTKDKPIHALIKPRVERKLDLDFQKEVIRLFVGRGLELEILGDNDRSPIQLAIQTKQFELAHFLLSYAKPFAEDNSFGFQELVLAARHKNKKLIEALVQKNARLTTKHAVLLKERDLVRDMLAQDPTQKDDQTLVQFAVQYRHIDMAIFLMDLGVTTKFKNRQKNSALHYAVLAQSEKLLKDLLARNVDANGLNARSLSPLHFAIEVKFEKGIDILAANNCDLNIRSGMYGSPIEYAITSVRYDYAKKLLRLGADPNKARTFPLHRFCSQSTTKTGELLDLLLEKTKDINRADRQGKTALHYALGGFINRQTVEKLLIKGADIMAEDSAGVSPYNLARISEDVELIELMLKYADDP